MKDKVSLDNVREIAYIANLITLDIRTIEANLNASRELLQKFKDKSGK